MSHSSSPITAAVTPKPIPKVRTWFWRSFPAISDDIQRGFEQHGDLIQLQGFAVRVYCLRNPEHIECVFKDPKVGISKIPSAFPRLKAMMPHSVVVQAGGRKWEESRKRMKRIFENDFMRSYAEHTTELTQQMLDQRWEAYADAGDAFDFYREFQLLLTRLAFRILFSKKMPDDQIEDIQQKCFYLESQFPQRLPAILPTRQDSKYRRYMSELRSVMSELIAGRRESQAIEEDLLQVLLEARDDHGKPFPDDWAIDHMIEMYNSVRLVNPPLALGVRLVAQNPEVQKRLVEEARELTGGYPPRSEDFANFKYLQMVISETFRFYPSAVFLPRLCEDGMSIDGHQIPPKSIVVPMIYHTHRNPAVYPEPLRFDPDRWNPDNERKIHPYARLGFGSGKRTCLGYNLAILIMRVAMTSVFQRYYLETRDPDGTDATRVELSIHPRKPVLVSIRRVESVDTSVTRKLLTVSEK